LKFSINPGYVIYFIGNLRLSLNTNDTCGGTVAAKKLSVGAFLYTFTPGTAQVNTQCVIGLTASDGKKETEQNTTVDIGDENAAPYFTSNAPTTATEAVFYTYNITVADDNVPTQSLTITREIFDTCGGIIVDNGDGTGAYTFTPNENDGGVPCLISLTVTDSMGEKIDQNTIVTVNEDNKAPLNNAPANVAGDELTLITFNINPTDPDIPAQALTCSIQTNNCPGGALNGCTFEWTPTEAQGPDAGCDVITRVSDGTLTNDATTTVTVNETNEPPYFTSVTPSTATEGVIYTYNITVADDDIPAQTLIITGSYLDACAGTLTDNGDGTGTYTFTPDESQGGSFCIVSLKVTDSIGASAEQHSIVNIIEVNDPPTVAVSCPANAYLGSPVNCTIIAADPNTADVLTCSLAADDTCGGVLTDCTAYDIAAVAADCRVSVDVADNPRQRPVR